MNILYINHYAGSFNLGMEYRPWMLAKEWQDQNHNIRVVASEFSHLRQVKINFKNDFHIQKFERSIEYQWVKTPKYKGNGIKRFVNILCFIFKIFIFSKKITNDFKPDVVIASSTYPLDIFSAYFIAKTNNAKLVHEVHDLWPLTLKELGGFKSWHPMILLFQFAENFSYRFSDRVVSMLPFAWEYMQQHGLSKNRYVVVPNGVKTSEWDNSIKISKEMEEIILEKKQQGYFLIGYAGSLGVSNAMNFFIETLASLKDEKVFAFIVGNGPERDILLKQSKDYKINNIVFFDTIGKNQIPFLLSLMDSLYVGWHKKTIYNYGTNPNKILDYMMARKPIIHSVSASNDLVIEANAGISVPAEDVTLIAEAIVKLKNMNENDRHRLGANGRHYVEKNLEYDYLAKKFLMGL